MRYLLPILLVLTSCGSRKVHKTDVEQKVKHTEQVTVVDTSKSIKLIDTNTKVLDTSEESEICVTPLDTTKPFIYENKTFKNVVLRIKKHKNNITTQTSEKVSEKRSNAITKVATSKTQTQIEVAQKDIEKRNGLLSYWWILLLIAIVYIVKRVYDKNKYI